MSATASFPLFLRLEDKLVLVVGGGTLATSKARTLVSAGARLRIVAPAVSAALRALAGEVHHRAFEEGDLDGVWLVVTAATPAVNLRVRALADQRQLFVVAVDDVASCSAYGAAQLQRAGLTIAISSDGRSPGVVALLRRALDEILGDDVEGWIAAGERARKRWRAQGIPAEERRPLLLEVLSTLDARRAP